MLCSFHKDINLYCSSKIVAGLLNDSMIFFKRKFRSLCKVNRKFVAQSCLILCKSMDCSLPVSTGHGIPQARIMERVTIPFSRGSTQPRDQTQGLLIAGRFFTIWAIREAPKSTDSNVTILNYICISSNHSILFKWHLYLLIQNWLRELIWAIIF